MEWLTRLVHGGGLPRKKVCVDPFSRGKDKSLGGSTYPHKQES